MKLTPQVADADALDSRLEGVGKILFSDRLSVFAFARNKLKCLFVNTACLK